jgi:hypothetical protein
MEIASFDHSATASPKGLIWIKDIARSLRHG